MLKNEKGFTLIEMLIVLLIISVLILLTVPNLLKHNETIDDKGCEAYVKIIESQVQLYKLEHNTIPTIDELESGEYIEQTTCPNGQSITIDPNGNVDVASS